MIDKKIKALREHNNYTQDDLAVACNVTRSAISNWENDRREPSSDKIKIIACVFNVTIEELLNDDISIDDILNKKEPQVISSTNFSDDHTIKGNKKINSIVQKINYVLTVIVTICLLLILIPAMKDNRFSYIEEEIKKVETVTLQLSNYREVFEYEMIKHIDNQETYYKAIVDTTPVFYNSDIYYFINKINVNIIVNGDKRLSKILLINDSTNCLYIDSFYNLELNKPNTYEFIFCFQNNYSYIGAFVI